MIVLKAILVLCAMAVGYGLIAWGSSFHSDGFFSIFLSLLGILVILCSGLYGFIKMMMLFKRRRY